MNLRPFLSRGVNQTPRSYHLTLVLIRFSVVFCVLVMTYRAFDLLPWKRLLEESGNGCTSFNAGLCFVAFLLTAIAGFFTGHCLEVEDIKWVLFRTILLLIAGYICFSLCANIGVRRFILGTETWRVGTHMEHFFRFSMLVFPPCYCLGLGFFGYRKGNVHSRSQMAWSIAFVSLAFAVWYIAVIHNASTVLVLDILVDQHRIYKIFAFFAELTVLGCFIGSLGFVIEKPINPLSIIIAVVNMVLGSLLIGLMFETAAKAAGSSSQRVFQSISIAASTPKDSPMQVADQYHLGLFFLFLLGIYLAFHAVMESLRC
jgi:hypothetical protein